MYNKLLLFNSILLFNCTFLPAQTEKEGLSFYNNFNSIEFDLLHIYTDGSQERSYLVIFECLRFKHTLVKNSSLQQSLEKEFPYRVIQAPFRNDQMQKEALKAPQKSGLVIPSEQD
jgi:hypothetical protein